MKPSFFFYANPYQPKSVEAARSLCEELKKCGAAVYAEDWLAQRGIGREAELRALPQGIRAAVVFGGDGTMLRCASDAARQRIPLLGVHTGTVGFLMPGNADEPERIAQLLLRPAYPEKEYPMLQARCQGKTYLCVNDISMTRGEHPGVIEVTVQADGELLFCAHGDGAVVSTPLGCTAYGLAAGGPVVRPDAHCLMVTPLCARELLLRPVILPLDAKLSLSVHGRERRRLQLAIDGQTLIPITDDVQVEIDRAEERLRLIHPEPLCFFDTLRQKQAVWNQ